MSHILLGITLIVCGMGEIYIAGQLAVPAALVIGIAAALLGVFVLAWREHLRDAL